jgi:thioredoxin reductase (NADPH)
MKKIMLWLHFFILALTGSLRAEVVEEEVPVMILGGGVAALTSAVYLSRAGIAPIVVTGPVVGGTITQSHNVQNWPGEVAISGLELGDKVRRQAEMNGAILRPENVVSVDFSKRPYLINTKKVIGSNEQLKRYRAQSVIIAIGATPNLLHVPGESIYWSQGVYNCAVCDGSLYKDKVVAVVGGGDSALIEAQYLSNIASKVHILVRKDEFGAIEKQRLKEVLSTSNIQVHYKTIVREIKGDSEKVTHLLLQDSATQTSWQLPADAVFLAIGALPNTEMFRNQIDLDEEGYIVLKKHQQTSLEGVYAIGDIADPEFKQAVSAAGDAAKAALQAQKFLSSCVVLHPKLQLVANVENKPEIRTAIEIYSREQLEKELHESKGLVFVDFYSAQCGPCRVFSSIYEDWVKAHGSKAKFLKVNVERSQELFAQFQIYAVPTLIILDEKGNSVRRSVGSKEISEVDRRLEKMKGNTIFSSLDFK